MILNIAIPFCRITVKKQYGTLVSHLFLKLRPLSDHTLIRRITAVLLMGSFQVIVAYTR